MEIGFMKDTKDVVFDDWVESEIGDLGRETLGSGAILVFFTNLSTKIGSHHLDAYKQCIDNGAGENLKQYYDLLAISLEPLCGRLFAKLIIMDVINGDEPEYREVDTIDSAKRALKSHLQLICGYARLLALTAADSQDGTTENPMAKALPYIKLESLGDFDDKISYGVYPGWRNGKRTVVDLFVLHSSIAAIQFDFSQVIRDEIVIKKCANCGKYFVPSIRSDEIYCENVFRNNKTCKQLGYETKVMKDDVLKEYRKIYKTQNARKQRNKHKSNIDARFDRWKVTAKDTLLLCQKGEISIEQMTSDISGVEWMDQEVLNNG